MIVNCKHTLKFKSELLSRSNGMNILVAVFQLLTVHILYSINVKCWVFDNSCYFPLLLQIHSPIDHNLDQED